MNTVRACALASALFMMHCSSSSSSPAVDHTPTKMGDVDDGGDGPGTDATTTEANDGSRALSVSITPQQAALCPGSCVDLRTVVGGGKQPYTVTWDHGATGDGGAARVCPTSATTYTTT